MAKKAGVRKESKCAATCPECILYDTRVIPTAGRRCSGSWGSGSRSRNHMYITTELLLLLLNSSGSQRPSYDSVTKFSISGEALKLTATGSRQMLLIIKHNRDDLRGRRRSAYQHGHCMPPWRMPQLNKRTAERLCQKTAPTDGRQSCLGCVSKTSTNMGHVVTFGAAAPYPLFRICRAAS